MGIFSGIKRQLLKVITWEDDSTNVIVYKYPMTDRDEIMNGCQLVVRESQCAMLVSSGQICDVYGPGTHQLTTNNMPIITKLASWKYGFDSPFKADVYYVNTKQFINLKWGTASRVSMRDKDFGVIRVGGRGSYSFRVEDAPKFMREIFGTNKEYTTTSLIEYFKSIIVTGFTTVLGTSKIAALDLPMKLMEFGEEIKLSTDSTFHNLGIEIVNFNVESVNLPENVEKAIDERSTVGVIGDVMGQYTQYQIANAIRETANNGGGGIAESGVGLGAGIMMGQTMANVMGQNIVNNQQNNQPNNTQNFPVKCPKCGQGLPEGAKFCFNCGEKLETVATKEFYCMECGTKNPAGSKFCINCGKPTK